MQPLIKKYAPKKISDIVGQDITVKELISYIKNFNKEKKKALLLHGSIGVGKTSSVHVVSNELGLEILELNASEFRNAEQIELKVGNAIKQQSLFAKGKIILLDDVDGLSGRGDRGGVQALIKLIEQSPYPIILTATNAYEGNLRALVKKCKQIEFKKLDYTSIFTILKKICDNEGIKYSEKAIKELSYSSAGDARSAINDMGSLIFDGKEITSDKVKEIGERNRKDKIITAINKVFKTTNLNVALEAFENVEEDAEQQILWLDENLPKEYTNVEDLARAYDALSLADVFNRRIKRRQYYRLLVYINALITGGISLSKNKKYNNYLEYKPTNRILKMWIINQKLRKKKSIAAKIAPKIHKSEKDTLKTLMPYLPIIFKNKKIRNELIEGFKLDEEEVEWLSELSDRGL